MSIAAIIMLILGIVGAVGGIGTGIAQAVTNRQAVESTNETNYKISQETNQSNVEQAELAYQRSLPLNQVRNLVAAGMSKQGALNSLTGGGSYTAPALQSAQMQAPQNDFSQIGAGLERLMQVPSSVVQADILKEQRNALAVQTQTRLNEDLRRQREHEFNMWKQSYDKNSALMLDSAGSKIAQKLLDSGKTIQDFKDFEHMIRELGLSEDKDIRNLNHVARTQLEQSVRDKFENERARQNQINANLSARDAHTLALDTLKNSEFGRTLSSKQVDKIDAEITALEDSHNEHIAAAGAREKENALRESRATLEKLMNDFEISKEELRKSVYFNDNGTPNLDNEVQVKLKEFWRMVGNVLPIEYLGDILRGMFALGSK